MNGIPLTHNVFAFIQARTTSTRLPNKVLRPFVNDKTILHFVVERVHKVLPKSKIVLLIPEGDQALVQFAEENQILFFEGSEQDVRDRFIQAAKKFQATWILRLTGDNPFVDIEHLSYLVEATRFTHCDLLSFEQLPIGVGAEIFRTSALVREPKSGITPEHSEHVSLHIKQYPVEYSVLKLKPLVQDLGSITQIRLTIDEEVDFLTCRDIYLEFQNNEFGVREILTLYKEKPEIFQKNKSVQQVKFFIPTTSSYNESRILIIH
ncbi:MAG: spore coat biosynthesis protein F, partial [Leptospiraceae bacterium]|nr:spore coat biosynthesis protein F [Leptospiraceae bacterium]